MRPDPLVYSGKSFDIDDQDGSLRCIRFKPDGKTMFLTGSENNRVYSYTLDSAWEINSATPDLTGPVGSTEKNLNVSEQLATPLGLYVSTDGAYLYAGGAVPDKVFQYSAGAAIASKFGFRFNGCNLYWSQNGGVYQIDLPCANFTAPSSSAPDAFSRTRPLAGRCIVIESSAIGTCASEQVVVVKQGNITTQFSSPFLGGQALCGAQQARLFDANKVQESTATNVITGATHLAGEVVGVWGDGQDLGFYTVSSTGQITLPVVSTAFVYGKPYDSWYKSVKLAYADQHGSALTQRKKVDHLGFILYCTHARGLEYGPSTTDLQPMPQIENGKLISSNSIWPTYDEETIEFKGDWNSDSRVILHGRSPRVATVLGAIVQMQTKEKV